MLYYFHVCLQFVPSLFLHCLLMYLMVLLIVFKIVVVYLFCKEFVQINTKELLFLFTLRLFFGVSLYNQHILF